MTSLARAVFVGKLATILGVSLAACSWNRSAAFWMIGGLMIGLLLAFQRASNDQAALRRLGISGRLLLLLGLVSSVWSVAYGVALLSGVLLAQGVLFGTFNRRGPYAWRVLVEKLDAFEEHKPPNRGPFGGTLVAVLVLQVVLVFSIPAMALAVHAWDANLLPLWGLQVAAALLLSWSYRCPKCGNRYRALNPAAFRCRSCGVSILELCSLTFRPPPVGSSSCHGERVE